MSKDEFYYIVADLDDKGFKIKAEGPKEFSLDPTGANALTNFFIELLDLNNSQVEELFVKYQVTVHNKTK